MINKKYVELKIFDHTGIVGNTDNLTPEDIASSRKEKLAIQLTVYGTELTITPSLYNVDNEVLYLYKLRKFYQQHKWYRMADTIYWKLILNHRVIVLDGYKGKRDRLRLVGDRAIEFVNWNKDKKKYQVQAYVSSTINEIKFNSRYFPEVAKYRLRAWNDDPLNPNKILIKLGKSQI